MRNKLIGTYTNRMSMLRRPANANMQHEMLNILIQMEREASGNVSMPAYQEEEWTMIVRKWLTSNAKYQ